MHRDAKRLAFALGLALALAQSQALAAQIGINPTLVSLNKALPTGIVSLTNMGTQAARFELRVLAWGSDSKGEMVLTPTEDVLFFPKLFALAPGETRQIRLGAANAFGAVERSYRLVVQELPPLRKPAERLAGLVVLSRLLVPIFLAPDEAREASRIEPLDGAPGALGFKLHNVGTVHVRPTTVRARTVDGDGEAVSEKTWDGWYVLAGGQREYRLELPAGPCSKVRAVDVEIVSAGQTLRDRLALPGRTCGL